MLVFFRLCLIASAVILYGRQCGCVFFFQAEDGIRDAQESRGLGDVYKRQPEQAFDYRRNVWGKTPNDAGSELSYATLPSAAQALSLIHI